MYPCSSKGLNKKNKTAIYFYTPAFDAFNNFSAHQVTLWGRRFPTVEHAYQWKKFSDAKPDIAKQIFEAGSRKKRKESRTNINHLCRRTAMERKS